MGEINIMPDQERAKELRSQRLQGKTNKQKQTVRGEYQFKYLHICEVTSNSKNLTQQQKIQSTWKF